MRRNVLALFGCAAILSGCFEASQDFVFNSDRTVTAKIRLAVDAALLAMSAQGNDKPDNWCKGNVDLQAVSSTSGSDSVCTFTFSGTMDDVVAKAAKATSAGADSKSQTVSLREVAGNYVFAIELPVFADKEKEPDETGMREAMEAMLLARMSGRVLSWSVKAPQIISSTGDISEDRTTATYSRPLAEAYVSSEPSKFQVEFSLDEPGVLGGIKRMFQ